MKKVVIYTTPTCTYCKASKEFFKANNVPFEEYNVATDLEKRKEMFSKAPDNRGVPLITVDDEVVIGFDKERLQHLLGV